jgi:hypothetical protein
MKFDRQSAVPIFARKESDELIQIAFLEESYVEEAKDSRDRNWPSERLCRRHFNRRACGLLGVSSASVLDRAGYSDCESQAVMERLGETSDEEIASEPI